MIFFSKLFSIRKYIKVILIPYYNFHCYIVLDIPVCFYEKIIGKIYSRVSYSFFPLFFGFAPSSKLIIYAYDAQIFAPEYCIEFGNFPFASTFSANDDNYNFFKTLIHGKVAENSINQPARNIMTKNVVTIFCN